MKIKWLGRSCFHIKTSEGLQIATDPYSDGMGYPPLSLEANIVTTSHSHGDHNNISAITGEFTLIETSGAHTPNGLSIRGINTYHDADKGSKRGQNIVYVLTIDGLNVCHCGDLGHVPTEEQREKIGHVDILLVPTGGFYTMPMEDVTETISLLNPTITIPMHYCVHQSENVIAPIEDFLKTIPAYEKAEGYLDISSSNIGSFKPVIVLSEK